MNESFEKVESKTKKIESVGGKIASIFFHLAISN
jgi:hypothetical protein